MFVLVLFLLLILLQTAILDIFLHVKSLLVACYSWCFFYIFNLISFIEQMKIAVKQQSAQEWTQLYRVHTICTIFRCSFPSFSLAKNTPLHHANYQWWSSCVQCHLLYSCVIVPMLSRWKLIIVSSKPSGRDCWNNCEKQTRYSNDWTIVEIGRNKILWFVSVW